MKTRPIPEYGDLFTVEDFKESVEHGHFIPYDGDGYYATKEYMTDISVWGSIKNPPKDLTHVVWFNR